MATDYVLGFLFDPDYARVLTIRKNRPAWQAGLLNGIGGRVEPGETPEAAMVREADEEAGLVRITWKHFATLRQHDGNRVFVFKAVLYPGTTVVNSVRQQTDEQLYASPVFELVSRRIYRNHPDPVSNVPWLVAMALDQSAEGQDAPVLFDVLYTDTDFDKKRAERTERRFSAS